MSLWRVWRGLRSTIIIIMVMEEAAAANMAAGMAAVALDPLAEAVADTVHHNQVSDFLHVEYIANRIGRMIATANALFRLFA